MIRPDNHLHEERTRMTIWSRSRFATVFLAAGLAVGVAGMPASAQSGPSDWVVTTDGPGSDGLSSGRLAADATGAVVLIGYDGSTAPTKGKKPLDVASRAWYSPDGTAWAEAALAGGDGSAARAVTAGPAGFVAVGQDKTAGRIWHSPTGESWTEVSGDSAKKASIFDVAAGPAGPAGYVAAGSVTAGKGKKQRLVPTAWMSADGITWTSAPIADLDGIGVSVAASPEGGLLAAVYQFERKGPTKNGVFDILPPGLAFFSSADGVAWAPAGDSPAADASQLVSWDLMHAGGQYRFIANRAPSGSDGPNGQYASPDGAVWTPVPGLLGLTGATGPVGDGVIALGDSAIMTSADGSTWAASVDEALTGSRTRSVVGLPDGRVLAAGPTPDGSSPGYVLYSGAAPTGGVVHPSDCVDAGIVAEITAAGTGLFDLAAPDRERIAAALAAYVPAEGTFQVREAMVTALRSGGSLDGMAMSGLLSGQTVITPCA